MNLDELGNLESQRPCDLNQVRAVIDDGNPVQAPRVQRLRRLLTYPFDRDSKRFVRVQLRIEVDSDGAVAGKGFLDTRAAPKRVR